MKKKKSLTVDDDANLIGDASALRVEGDTTEDALMGGPLRAHQVQRLSVDGDTYE